MIHPQPPGEQQAMVLIAVTIGFLSPHFQLSKIVYAIVSEI